MIIILFVFLLGLAVGSFLNVVIFRARGGEGIGGRSKCPNCFAILKASDMVPVASYVVLGGKCRYCGAAISRQYPVVEFATGALFVLFFLRYYLGWSLPGDLSVSMTVGYLARDLIFTAFLIILFIYDFRYYMILDRFTIPAMVVAFVLNLLLGVSPLDMLAAGLIIGGFFLVQFMLSQGIWIGGGDVRMGVLMGLILWVRDGLAALVIAYAIGALVGVFLLLLKRANMKTQVPFGTFLAFATLIMLLAGDAVIEWYIALIGGPGELVDFLEIGKDQILLKF